MRTVSPVSCQSHTRQRTHCHAPKKAAKKVLIVDDEALIRYSLQHFVADEGFTVFTADSGIHALKSLEEDRPDIVILDIHLPDANGLTLLKTIKEADPNVTVIMITGLADIQSTVEAMKKGALDYLEKPIDFEKLTGMLKAMKPDGSAEGQAFFQDDFIFSSSSMKEVVRITERLATKDDVTVLVLGESGTGKSYLCKIMHEMGHRSSKPFVEIGCSNIPEHLIESELFGHEKGAFTDAKAAKKGLVEIADSGSVLFDEIGDMPYRMQSKILSLIEEKKFRRVGGLQNIQTDVRIFAATNRNLYELVQSKKFRLDLFYRLNVVTIEMPPLRDRREDIPLLANHYLRRFAEKHDCQCKGISERAVSALQAYSWPGNIRELKNLAEKLVILSKCEMIDVDDLPAVLCASRKQEQHAPPMAHPAGGNGGSPEQATGGPLNTLSLKSVEVEYIRKALEMAHGNQRKAARLLDISRDTLRYRLKKLGIDSSAYTN